MPDLDLATLVPQQSDSVHALLQRLAGRVATDWIEYLPSVARTTITIGEIIDARGYSAVTVRLTISAYSGSASPAVVMYDDTLSVGMHAATGGLSSTGTKFFNFTRTVAASSGTAHVNIAVPLPSKMRLAVVPATADSCTYGLHYQLLP